MIIKQGEFVSFTPAELHGQAVMPALARPYPPAASTTRPKPKRETPSSRSDLLQEVERLVRANERLTLERDQLRDELSRQSLQVRRAKLKPTRSKHVSENLRRQVLPPAPIAREQVTLEPSPGDITEDPGFELARVVVNWFWEDADQASVRLVHDALTGQGIRTLVRDADTEAE